MPLINVTGGIRSGKSVCENTWHSVMKAESFMLRSEFKPIKKWKKE